MLALRSRIVAALAAGFTASMAMAGDGARVLILSSTDSGLDGHAEVVLESFGHTATVGPAFTEFTDKISLAEYDVVYLQANANWFAGDMPDTGQTALVNFVNAGGGLITSEWVVWLVNGSFRFTLLNDVFGGVSSGNYDFELATTYTKVGTDAIINAGLPDVFEIPLTSFSGTQTEVQALPESTTFYSSSTYPSGTGVVGVQRGQGRVIHLSTCVGAASLSDANFQRLFSNCVEWLNAGKTECRADFNGDGSVSSQDFFDFLTAFFTEIPSADFNGDGSINSQDFFDFLSAFFVGC